METKSKHLSQVPVLTGLPRSISNPVKPELFMGKHEAQLGKSVGITQFGVNHVTLEPGSISSLGHWHEGEDEFGNMEVDAEREEEEEEEAGSRQSVSSINDAQRQGIEESRAIDAVRAAAGLEAMRVGERRRGRG